MKNIKSIVKENYGQIATNSGSCCGGGSCCSGSLPDLSKFIGYTDEQLNNVPEGANLGLGCGNPLALATLKSGEKVLDLGSGAGFDVFLAARKVGSTGKVIGVDMTKEMIQKAKENAVNGKFTNVDFHLGDIEDLPVESETIDAIISNCVINLAPNKDKVFAEAYRVLKPGGRLMISDVVLSKELPENLKHDNALLTGCVSGAILKDNYLKILNEAGFKDITITKEVPMFLEEYALSISFTAIKSN